MADIIIRKAKREDCKAISTLAQELAHDHKMSNKVKVDYKTLEKDGFDGQPLFFCNVAVSGEKVVGFAMFCYIYSPWYRKIMSLKGLHVTQDFRGKHIGSNLLKSVAKEAVQNDCYRLQFEVHNSNPAQEFYKKHGANDHTFDQQWHIYSIPNANLKKLASVNTENQNTLINCL